MLDAVFSARSWNLLVTIGAAGIPSFSSAMAWPATAGVQLLQ
jgi:hypothetical protein